MKYLIYALIYIGSGLMVYNIYGFVRYARFVRGKRYGGGSNAILNIPIALLVMFLLGYLAVGIFLPPELIVALILFGGSIFVFIMYRLLWRITRRIIEQGQLESKLMAEEESNRTKIEFLSTVSHEMRTPVNIIMGLDEVALQEPDLSPAARDHLQKIGLSARHLLGLINNLLDMKRVQEGLLATRESGFHPMEMLAQISLVAVSKCEEKKLTYTYSGPHELPFCVGDEAMLRQVMISLLDNAVKFTDAPGRVELAVECEEQTEETILLRMAVKDTGVGIDSAFLPKLFTAFTKESTGSTDRFGGSGLSLAMTKRMVEMMGGAIEVESQKNVGSVFTVTVLLKRGEEVQQPEEDEGRALAGRRVLVVEDMPENAEIVMDLLELEQIETEHAENGQIAVDMFCASPAGHYDAILMDLRMPVMDGLTAARTIRSSSHPDARRVPIIALTANAMEGDVKNTFEAGMNAHLVKPSDADTLYRTLRKFI